MLPDKDKDDDGPVITLDDTDDDDSPFDVESEEKNLDDYEGYVEEQEKYEEEPAGEISKPDISNDSPYEDNDDDDVDDTDDADAVDPDPEPDTVKYSKNVQKRIDKEVSRRKSAEAAVRAANERVQNMERQATQQAAENITRAVTGLEAQERDLEARLRSAVEDGDTDRHMEANSQLMEVKLSLRQARAAKERIPQNTGTDMDPLARSWLDKHKDWWADPDHAGVQGFIMGVDAQMAKAGRDKSSPEYYEALDKALSEKFPDVARLGGVEPAGRKNKPERKKTSVVASATRGGSARRTNPDRIPFTEADKQQMRIFSLDPKNKEDVKEFYLQRRSSILRENAERTQE